MLMYSEGLKKDFKDVALDIQNRLPRIQIKKKLPSCRRKNDATLKVETVQYRREREGGRKHGIFHQKQYPLLEYSIKCLDCMIMDCCCKQGTPFNAFQKAGGVAFGAIGGGFAAEEQGQCTQEIAKQNV
ncbi:hypothetical protein NC651_021616 [Populus alba x Populus x berolinensis]|nr:hypothetical protein NC651_021616 [Populus alba x Populus x berolinensis]